MTKLISAEGIALISLNVALFGSFIGIFFFTFGGFVAKLVLKREITLILDSFIRDIKPFVSDEFWEDFQEYVRTLPKPDTSGDRSTEDFFRELLNVGVLSYECM